MNLTYLNPKTIIIYTIIRLKLLLICSLVEFYHLMLECLNFDDFLWGRHFKKPQGTVVWYVEKLKKEDDEVTSGRLVCVSFFGWANVVQLPPKTL